MILSLALGTGATLAPAPLVKWAIDSGILPGNLHRADADRRAVPRRRLVVWAATIAQTYLVEWVGQRALADLRMAIFDQLQRLPVSFYERRPAGVLISRMTNDVEALDSLVTDSVVTLFQGGLTLIGTLVILVVLDVRLALLTFTMLPLIAIGSLIFRIVSADAYRRTRETIGEITGYLQESLSGVRVVRAFGQERRHAVEFAELNERNREANMRTVNLNAAYFPAIEFVSAVATVVGAALRRLPGARRRDPDRRPRRLHDGADQLLQPDHAALAALHDLSGRHGGARQDLRAARRGARHDRGARRDAARPDPRRAASSTT